MNFYILITGLTILFFILFDIYYTALGLSGGGILSRLIGRLIWNITIKNKSNLRSTFLPHIGVLILISILSFWILITWIGVFLIFSAKTDSILGAFTQKPTDMIQKFYFSGYILSTLGNGEFIPNGYFAQFMTAFSGFSGFLIISFSATYLISVRNAVTTKLQLTKYISSLGVDVQSTLETGWNQENFNQLQSHFSNILPILLEHNNNHHAFPILHYFHYHERSMSFPINMGILMEVVFILQKFPKKFYSYSLNPLIFGLNDYFLTINKLLPIASSFKKSPIAYENEVAKSFGLDEYIDVNKKEEPLLTEVRKKLAAILEEQNLDWDSLYKASDKEKNVFPNKNKNE